MTQFIAEVNDIKYTLCVPNSTFWAHTAVLTAYKLFTGFEVYEQMVHAYTTRTFPKPNV